MPPSGVIIWMVKLETFDPSIVQTTRAHINVICYQFLVFYIRVYKLIFRLFFCILIFFIFRVLICIVLYST
jgi:hypothetical protein